MSLHFSKCAGDVLPLSKLFLQSFTASFSSSSWLFKAPTLLFDLLAAHQHCFSLGMQLFSADCSKHSLCTDHTDKVGDYCLNENLPSCTLYIANFGDGGYKHSSKQVLMNLFVYPVCREDHDFVSYKIWYLLKPYRPSYLLISTYFYWHSLIYHSGVGYNHPNVSCAQTTQEQMFLNALGVN